MRGQGVIQAPKLSTRLQAELDDLRARYGIEPTAEEILWLARACDRCDNPSDTERLDLIGCPREIGKTGVYLWQLTVGASCWLDEFAARWWGEKSKRYYWALVYALAHARTSGAFTSLVDEGVAAKKIHEFGNSLTASSREIEYSVDVALGRPSEHVPSSKKKEEQGKKADWLEIVRGIEVGTGIKADEWLWGRSAAYTIRAYGEMRQIITARAGGKPSHERTSLDAALNNLARIKKAIKVRHDE